MAQWVPSKISEPGRSWPDGAAGKILAVVQDLSSQLQECRDSGEGSVCIESWYMQYEPPHIWPI